MQLIPLTGTITLSASYAGSMSLDAAHTPHGDDNHLQLIVGDTENDAAHTPHGDDNTTFAAVGRKGMMMQLIPLTGTITLSIISLDIRNIGCSSYPSRGRNKTRDGKLLLSIPCFHLLGKINLRPSGLEYLPRQRLFPDPSCRSPPLLLLCRIYCTKQLYPAFFIAFCLLSSG